MSAFGEASKELAGPRVNARSLVIRGGAPLRGRCTLPPDPFVVRRAYLLAALAEGETTFASDSTAIAGTLIAALRDMGVHVEQAGAAMRVVGRGLRGLEMPGGDISCAGSLDTLALLVGALAGQSFGTRVVSSTRISASAIEHMVPALRARGFPLSGARMTDGSIGAPIAIAPLLAGDPVQAIECNLPRPDLAAKTALLIAGLFAEAKTLVAEPLLSPDHTERMLSAMGVPIRRVGSVAGFDPDEWDGRLVPLTDSRMPGDPVAASMIAAIASVIVESRVALDDISWNPTRTGFFDALRLLGARVLPVAKGDRAVHEPIAEVQVGASPMRGGAMGGEIVHRAGEALPALAVLGVHSVRGIQLLDGESFALATDPFWPRLADLLASFGADAQALGAGIRVAPGRRLRATECDIGADERLAWPAVLCGLLGEGETTVRNAQSWLAEHADTIAALRGLGAHIEVDS